MTPALTAAIRAETRAIDALTEELRLATEALSAPGPQRGDSDDFWAWIEAKHSHDARALVRPIQARQAVAHKQLRPEQHELRTRTNTGSLGASDGQVRVSGSPNIAALRSAHGGAQKMVRHGHWAADPWRCVSLRAAIEAEEAL